MIKLIIVACLLMSGCCPTRFVCHKKETIGEIMCKPGVTLTTAKVDCYAYGGEEFWVCESERKTR